MLQIHFGGIGAIEVRTLRCQCQVGGGRRRVEYSARLSSLSLALAKFKVKQFTPGRFHTMSLNSKLRVILTYSTDHSAAGEVSTN